MKKGIDHIGIGVSYYVHDGNGNFVMTKRSKNCRDEHGRWDFGGGGIDHGDTIEQTLHKEVREEFDADIKEFEFLGYTESFRPAEDGATNHWVQFQFKVLVDRDQVKNNEPHKFDDLQWFTIDNLPSPLHSQAEKELIRFKKFLI